MTRHSFDAVVFAGGRGTRLGGVDKAEVIVQRERLVDRAVAAARAVGATRVIVVGPEHAGTRADVIVREDPPFTGPLAALAAALTSVGSPLAMLLACDLVHPAAVAEQLVGAAAEHLTHSAQSPEDPDGVVLCDETGHRQWLASCIDTDALRRGIAAIEQRGTLEGGSLASVFRGLTLQDVHARPGSTDDIDTPEHLARAQHLD